MCGIAGLVHFRSQSIDPGLMRRACDTMRHRGPDDEGHHIHRGEDFSLGLAAVRLAIIDPTPAGHQPMLSDDGRFVLVFNGEIYNHRELREALLADGCHFRSSADTEVVLQLLARDGSAGLQRLRGMYALGFFDAQTGHGLIARDHAGIKPLFWADDGRTFGFASEMKTLRMLHAWPTPLRAASLVHYVRYGYIPHPHTIYESMHCLPPGGVLSFNSKQVGRVESWVHGTSRVPNHSDAHGDSYSDHAAHLRSVIGRAVARQRVADVPVGAFLSGGLDSSVVAYHLAEATPEPINTFTVGFAEYPQYDERAYARQLARQIGADHREIVVSIREVLDSLPTVLDHFGQPFGDSSILPTALLSRLTRQHVTVALSGDGGDEIFGGYWRYLGHESIEAYRRLPAWFRRGLLEPLANTFGESKSSALANRVRQFRKLLRGNSPDPAIRHQAWSRILTPEAEKLVLTDDMTDEYVDRLRSKMKDSDPGHDALAAILAFDQSYGLPGDMLYKVDLASMMHSLEVRVPLLDEDVMAAAAAIPSCLKIHRGQRKRILHDAYRGRLPDAILDRPKMGFEIPLGEWFRGPLKSLFMDTVTRDALSHFAIIDYDGVMKLFAQHERRYAEHADVLFTVLSLCRWTRRRL